MKKLLNALFYYLCLPFIYLLSVLPFPLLYLLSDGIYIILFHLLHYRRGIVRLNLKNSFPNKTDEDIDGLERRFYHYFCDLFLETFKTLTISRKSMIAHCSFEPDTLNLFKQMADENQSFLIAMGHFGNWEWAGNSFSIQCKHQLYVIYHPLTNPLFDGLIYGMRTRFGTKLIAMKDTLRDILNNRKQLSATAFIADQAPIPDHAYWTNFLNQDTPVYLGIEKIALKVRYPIVYITIKRVKRGYYRIIGERLDLPFGHSDSGTLTEMHTRRLEADIIREPENWLWTHRRWKHKRP